jgi:hypothetical protein
LKDLCGEGKGQYINLVAAPPARMRSLTADPHPSE